MASVPLICNLALAHLGQARIEALSDSDAEARWCNEFYAHARDSVTQDAIWRHARGRQALSTLTNDREDDWAYRYARPSDCLRLRYLLPETGPFDRHNLVRYEVEGESIYSDEPNARAIYIKQVTEPGSFGPHFVNALSWYLAHLVAMPLTKDRKVMADMMAGYAQVKAQAVEVDEAETLILPTADEAAPDWLSYR